MVDAGSNNVLFVAGLGVSAVGFILLVFGLNRLLSPHHPTPEKLEPYECGMEQAGAPGGRVRVRYVTIALMFVIFDAEAALLIAVATKLHGSPLAFAEIGVFVLVLGVGLAYAWRKGALRWLS